MMPSYDDTKIWNFIHKHPFALAAAGFLALGLYACTDNTTTTTITLSAPAVTNTQTNAEVGFTHIQSAEQQFGRVEVLSATMDRDPRSTKDFVYVEVEGMPCVMHFPQANRGGLSCDWSKWEGKTFEQAINEQVVPKTAKVEIPSFIMEGLPKVLPTKTTQVNTTIVAPYLSGEYK